MKNRGKWGRPDGWGRKVGSSLHLNIHAKHPSTGTEASRREGRRRFKSWPIYFTCVLNHGYTKLKSWLVHLIFTSLDDDAQFWRVEMRVDVCPHMVHALESLVTNDALERTVLFFLLVRSLHMMCKVAPTGKVIATNVALGFL